MKPAKLVWPVIVPSPDMLWNLYQIMAEREGAYSPEKELTSWQSLSREEKRGWLEARRLLKLQAEQDISISGKVINAAHRQAFSKIPGILTPKDWDRLEAQGQNIYNRMAKRI